MKEKNHTHTHTYIYMFAYQKKKYCNIPLDDYWNITSQISQRTNAHGKQVRRRMFIKWYQLNSRWIINVSMNTFKAKGNSVFLRRGYLSLFCPKTFICSCDILSLGLQNQNLLSPSLYGSPSLSSPTLSKDWSTLIQVKQCSLMIS